ncbi:MAG: hypothetical protein ACJ798_13380 [Phenylobacterium sp.]
MTKRATITVLPSAEHPDYLTVQDAMLQIADLFALMRAGDGVDWKLVSATTNSPFTAVGEIVGPPEAPAALIAAASLAAQEAYQGLTDVLAGEQPGGDMDYAVLRRVLARNLNGIGITKIELDDDPAPVSITPADAQRGIEAISSPIAAVAPRRVRGSLEGELIDAGHFRRQPALKLRERSRGRFLWCRIPAELEDEFAGATSLSDVWKNARVRVRGWIEYSRRGEIAGMTAERIQHVRAKRLTFGQIHDRDFTEGLDAMTYLDRLREGDLG